MSLFTLAAEWEPINYGFLDDSAKREVRRRILKAIAIPGYQVPYVTREVPFARGWGTGGLQVTLSLVEPSSVVKVIDQGDDASVNASNIRRFIRRVAGAGESTDTSAATIIQSRHRIPEEKLRGDQLLVLQVPDPEPLRSIQPNTELARQMHADADYGLAWLKLYEQLVDAGRITQGAAYPVLVNGRYLASPSPIPRWDVPKLHMSEHLTILSAGREKRIYAIPPHTSVAPLVFDDVPYRVEEHAGLTCSSTGISGFFMNEIVQDGAPSRFELSDTGLAEKLTRKQNGEPIEIGPTWYQEGRMP